MSTELPDFLQKVIERYPSIWKSYVEFGEAVSASESLDPRTARLVKLALAIGAGREGAAHSHVRRALKQGISEEELFSVALLAITTVGWSGAMAALSWIDDEVEAL